MGYFSNGTEGDLYQEKYCSKCVHGHRDGGCWVWNQHQIRNYEDSDDASSHLHKLIPRVKDPDSGYSYNGACVMFINAQECFEAQAGNLAYDDIEREIEDRLYRHRAGAQVACSDCIFVTDETDQTSCPIEGCLGTLKAI